MKHLGWLAALAVLGCKGKSADVKPAKTTEPTEDTATSSTSTTTPTNPGDVQLYEVEFETNNQGYGFIQVPLNDGDRLHVSGTSDTFYLVLDRLTDAQGGVILDRNDWLGFELLTTAFYPLGEFGFSWPIRTEDGPVEGGLHIMEVVTADSNGQGVKGTVKLTALVSPPVEFKEIHADIWYADGIGDEPDLLDGVEDAIGHWERALQSINVRLVTHQMGEIEGLPADMTFVDNPDQDLVDAIADKEPDHFTVVIAEYNGSSRSGAAGIAGGIPGPMSPTTSTWVTASWLSHAGNNGVFSPGESESLGWTLAHEVSHFMGLFHPVECPSPYDCNSSGYDALDDTPTCNDPEDCVNQMGYNLMFPYSLCWGEGCIDAMVITDDQRGVLLNHAAMR